MRFTVFPLVAILLIPMSASGQEPPAEDDLDRRIARAEWMMKVGGAGLVGISILSFVPDETVYDDVGWRVGVTASLGAFVTGLVGVKLKRDAEREREERNARRHSVAVVPLGGSGVAGVYALRW